MRIIKKRLLGLLCILGLGAAAVIGLTSCGGGSGVVYKVNFYRDTKTLWQTMEVDVDKDLILPDDPERDGHVFIGWYTDKEYKKAFDKDAPIKGNVTLYAAWKELPAAPTNLKWNKTTETLSWEAKTGGGVSYVLTYVRDGVEETKTLDELSYAFTEFGNYQASVVVKEGEYKSKPSSSLSFSIAAPKYTVKFKDGDVDYAIAEVLDEVVTLPKAPTKDNAKFLGWYTDTNFDTVFDETKANNFFNLTKREDQTISVFAKWDIKPANPAKVERITYNAAKLGQEQKLYWQASTDTNLDSYSIRITKFDGTVVETATNLTTPQFVLNNSKYTAGVTYYAEIKVVSELMWEGNKIESETTNKEFQFNILPEDRFTVTFKVDGEKYVSDNVESGKTATLPAVEPTKTGFIFVKWLLADNTEFTATTIVTGPIDVNAYFVAKPVAPTAVTYQDNECSISWAAVNGVNQYFYQINDGYWQTTTKTKLTVYGLRVGQNSIKFKVVAPVDGLSGEFESEVSEINFTVTDLYVALNNEGNLSFAKIDESGKLAKPVNPTKPAHQFVKWTVENNFELTAINFETQTYTKTTMIYAMFYKRPVTPIGITYNAAKLGQEQKIYWQASTDSDFGHYSIKITDANSNVIEGNANLATAQFVLDNSKYTAGVTYHVEIKVISTLEWEGQKLESEIANKEFEYVIVPEDYFTVTFKVDGAEYSSDNVIDGGTATLPEANPSKTGYIFVRWLLADGTEFKATTIVTGPIDVHAYFVAKPVAPTAVTYKDSECSISWTAVSGASKYFYQINGGSWLETTGTKFTVYGLNKGINSIRLKVKAPVIGLEGEYESEVSEINFTVTDLYIALNNEGVISFAKVDESGKLAKPVDPTKPAYQFIKWTVDNNIESAAVNFETQTYTKTTMIYAMFYIRPAAPSRITYSAAKLGQEQKIYWKASTDINLSGYSIKITDFDGDIIQQDDNLLTAQFVLDDSLYTADVTYYAEVEVICTVGGYRLESETANKEFQFKIVPKDIYTVTFKVDGEKYSSDSVVEGETATLPLVNPTKTGYVFVKWVLADGTEFTATTTVTGPIDVYAYFVAKPAAPTAVTYKDSECSISWTAISGASKYFYQINGGLWLETTATTITVDGLSTGQNSIKLKVVAPVDGLSGEFESEISEINFTVTDLYIALNNQETITFVKVNADGKIAKPADPIKLGYQFIKWTVDNNLESGAINFETRTYTKTAMIYAMFYVRPTQIDSSSLAYDQDTDEITWDPVPDVDSYKVKWNGATKYITVTTPKIKANVSLSGNYDIEIIAVKNVPGIGYIESYAYSTENFEINLISETVYNSDGTQIKIVNAQGEATYIYFAGQTYYISGTEGYAVFADSPNYTKLPDHTRNAIKMNNVVTPTNEPFDLTFVVDGATHSRKALIVPQISTFTAGDVYQNAKTPSVATFIDTTQPYRIGVADTSNLSEEDYKQYYYLDLDLNYFAGDYQDVLVEFNFKFYIDGVDVTNTIASTYGITLKKDNGKYALNFNGTKTVNHIGKTLSVSLTPRYLNKAQYDEQTASQAWTRTFDFVLSKGVNVYTHENLKAAMADKACLGISIHSNIVAELAANQINDNGGAVNFLANTRTSYTYTNGQNSNREVVAGDVYRRDFHGATNKTLTVNGNYCTIDASAINKVKASTAYDEQWGYATVGEGYNIPSVHVGIFRVVGAASHGTTNHEQGTFNISNLEIRGNTEIRGSNKAEFEEYAGGYGGIHINDIALNADNVNVHHSNIAFFVHSNNNFNNYSLLKSIKTDQNWSNSLYSYGTSCVKILNSNIGLSSGAALHMEDVASNLYSGANKEVRHYTPRYDLLTDEEKASEIRLDPCLILGTNTVINNGMFGDEPYLTAYGLAAYVAQIKSELQTAVNENFNASILKQKPSSAETYFNFAFMFRPYAPCAQLEVGIYDESQNQIVNTWCYRSKAFGDSVGDGTGTYTNYNGATKETTALSVASGVGYADSQLLVPINQYLNANTKSRELFATYTQWYAHYAGFLALNPGQTENAIAYADSQVPAYNALKTLYEGDLDAAMKETAQGIVTATGGDATQMQQAIMATLFNGRTDRNDPATEYGSSTKIGGKSYYTIYLDGAAFGGGTDSNAVCIFEYGFGTGWYY